jgi:endonuclease-3
MTKLDVKTIQAIIRPCGLSPRKAKSIRELSCLLIENHNGIVPKDFEALESLPGVGHKTASVVMAQSFNIPSVPIDTHIHRLMERWGLSNGKNVVKTEEDFKKCFPISLWNKLHLQIIYFGREFCKARQHDPEACPICSWAMSKKHKKEQAVKRK